MEASMYRNAVVVVLALFAAVTLRAQEPTATEKEILKLEHDWNVATQKKDKAFMEKLYADEYLGTDPLGSTYTKSQDLATTTGGEFDLKSFELSDLKVHVYGDTAVVTGANAMKAVFKGKPIDGTFRFTDVFVKKNGRWQVVASQGTQVAPKS
jgi:ketosteroid isomerase-like protein